MAKMYAKIKGSTLNQGMVKAGGRFKENKNIAVDIDINRISNLVYRQVMSKLKSEDLSSKKPNDTSPINPEETKAKGRGRWKLSTVGFSMLTSQIATSVISQKNAYSSGDTAQMAMQTYTNVKGTGSLLLSTFGGPYGMVMAVILNRLDGLFGQYVKNQIQLQYDNARLEYNLTRMNIGKNSTYTYDYEQNKWRARDVENINSSILTQRYGS